jgi:preprotein translocase subunit SecY
VVGAAYLVVVCLLPDYVMGLTGQQQFFVIGGTSLLILVNVTVDTIAQIQGHLMAHQYSDLLKKAKLKGNRGR